MRAALLHIGGDALGAIAVVIGGLVIAATGANWVDPALSLFVSAIILAGIVNVVRAATHVLLESVPDHAPSAARAREHHAAAKASSPSTTFMCGRSVRGRTRSPRTSSSPTGA